MVLKNIQDYLNALSWIFYRIHQRPPHIRGSAYVCCVIHRLTAIALSLTSLRPRVFFLKLKYCRLNYKKTEWAYSMMSCNNTNKTTQHCIATWGVFLGNSNHRWRMQIIRVLKILENHEFVRFLPRCMECRRGLAMRILPVRPSVRLSVCLSIKRVLCDKIEEILVQIFISYER